MRLPRAAVLALAFGSLAAVSLSGCKQGIGQRCEQGSDCSSGYCDYTTAGGMTSAQGRVCTEANQPFVPPSPTPDAASDASPATHPDAASDTAAATPPDAATGAADAAAAADAQLETGAGG